VGRNFGTRLLAGSLAVIGAVAGLTPGAGAATRRARTAPHRVVPEQILSAFFGLDDGLPMNSIALCPTGPVADGMPVVFRAKVDVNTVWPWDFVVTTRSGARHVPTCATTAPANQASEDRTVLLIGELGEHATDPPVRVTVVDGLKDEVGNSLAGASAPVPPYGLGPRLVWAEPAPPAPDGLTFTPLTPRFIGMFQQNTECPSGTVQRVRVTWDGGITAPGGVEAGDAQRRAYTVTLAGGRTVVPFALADLGDHDNYHLLCLDTRGTPVEVTAAAGAFAAPHGDVNQFTSVTVQP
jgi:hypothetical protein